MKKKILILFMATGMVYTTAKAESVATFNVDEEQSTLKLPQLEAFYHGSPVGTFKAEMVLISDNPFYDFRVISSAPFPNNEEIVRRFLGELLSNGNLDVADDIMAPDAVIHTLDSYTPDFGKGPNAMKQIVSFYHAAFSDFQLTIEDITVTENKVASRFKISGVHTGDLPGFPATGLTINSDGMEIYSIVEGKIVEFWHVADVLGVRGIFTTVIPEPIH
jgi:ketosteroid isomerase-like protein